MMVADAYYTSGKVIRPLLKSGNHLTAYAGSPQVREAVTRIAMNYELMSQYTSFVAVDESELKRAKRTFNPPRKLVVPIWLIEKYKPGRSKNS